jgi:1-acyl-sn-glycerol-3-phosphate acyltransferase
MFHFYQIAVCLPLRTCFPTKFVGKKNLPKGACIIASNHVSNLDAILLALHTWEKKYYLAKKELFKGKISSSFYKGLGCIQVDRQISDVSAIKNSLKVLKNGKKLVIFPEGTRVNNEDHSMGEVKHGVAMLACKAKVPIVPMYILNKPKFLHRNKVFIGKPFTLEEFYGKKLSTQELADASEIVTTKINELREIALNSLTKKK